MSESDFNFIVVALPILCGFIAFLLGSVFKNEEYLAIVILLGVVAGCLSLISLLLTKLIIQISKSDK